jgi:glycosyltransferase involved in cell wall biosynthesis
MTIPILHVIESMTPGGMETTFLKVLRALRILDQPGEPAFSHDVLSFASGPLEQGYRAASDSLFIGNSRTQIESVLKNNYDVIHVLFDRCAHRLAPFLFRDGRSAVVYGKGYDISAMYRMQGDFDWSAEDSLLAACDGVTFTTGPLSELYRIPEGSATVLEKAVDYESFARIPPPEEFVPERIICIANLQPRKRLGDLIPMLLNVRKQVPAAEVTIVGGGNEQEQKRIEQLAASNGLAGVFSITGTCSDVAAQVAMSRVAVLPSACEGVPTSLLEAMAAGRPVVATRTGHVESIITDDCEGFLTSIGDIETMADCVSRLLLDRKLARKMGDAGRLRAANHDVRNIAVRLFDVLQNAASES